MAVSTPSEGVPRWLWNTPRSEQSHLVAFNWVTLDAAVKPCGENPESAKGIEELETRSGGSLRDEAQVRIQDRCVGVGEASARVRQEGLAGRGAHDVEPAAVAVLKSSPLAGMTVLKTLDVNGSLISDITPLTGMTKMRSPSLLNNDVTDIGALAGMTEMVTLTLDFNEISDLSPLGGMGLLDRLTVSHNLASDLSVLPGLASLSHVSLDADPSPRTVCRWNNVSFVLASHLLFMSSQLSAHGLMNCPL